MSNWGREEGKKGNKTQDDTYIAVTADKWLTCYLKQHALEKYWVIGLPLLKDLLDAAFL